MGTEYQFMVDFSLPDVLSVEFMDLISEQRAQVNRYFSEGKLVSYALSFENSKLWAIFNASSELEVLELITDLPLTRFMQVEVSVLTFYNTFSQEIPNFSMN
ncbi:MAG: hypothetical protein GY705_10475 [Bacteroidetes bacterium]|nr:hypothetical protein [Bacteroidota bacterium]